MIDEALLHCAGIGPKRLARLHARGIRTWGDVLARPDCLPGTLGGPLVEECRRCLAALAAGEIRYFTDRFTSCDKWRILSHYIDQASYFDIETDGLEQASSITVISCWHRGRLHTFVEHENLDAFLGLLDDVQLLVSFNGGSFDVPRVLDTFHVPELPCPHLDMRWTCYHRGLTGGLKEISRSVGIDRPADLEGADGELAVRLWAAWRSSQDASARELLIRYCASDVLLLRMLAQQQAGRADPCPEAAWDELPAAPAARWDRSTTTTSPVAEQSDGPAPRTTTFGQAFDVLFGSGSPQRLRARRHRTVG